MTLHKVKIKIATSITLPGNASMGHCLSSDSWLLDAFVVAPHHHHYKEIVLVVWQPPSVPWVKVNTDGSVVRQHVTCGGIFRDNRGSLMG